MDPVRKLGEMLADIRNGIFVPGNGIPMAEFPTDVGEQNASATRDVAEDHASVSSDEGGEDDEDVSSSWLKARAEEASHFEPSTACFVCDERRIQKDPHIYG